MIATLHYQVWGGLFYSSRLLDRFLVPYGHWGSLQAREDNPWVLKTQPSGIPGLKSFTTKVSGQAGSGRGQTMWKRGRFSIPAHPCWQKASCHLVPITSAHWLSCCPQNVTPFPQDPLKPKTGIIFQCPNPTKLVDVLCKWSQSTSTPQKFCSSYPPMLQSQHANIAPPTHPAHYPSWEGVYYLPSSQYSIEMKT